MIIIKLLTSFINRVLRNLYWIYRLSRINKGKGNIYFPIIFEGGGLMKIGNNYCFHRKSEFGLGHGSITQIGDQFKIGTNTKLKVSKNVKFEIGNNCEINSYSELYVNKNWKLGNNVSIAQRCAIFSREQGFSGVLKIDDGVRIGDGAILDLSTNITLGEDVGIGPNCVMYTHGHKKDETNNLPIWKSAVTLGEIIIKKKVYIGTNVTILPGVTIGEGSIIAAGSVINKSVPPFQLWGGVPAKQIKEIK